MGLTKTRRNARKNHAKTKPDAVPVPVLSYPTYPLSCPAPSVSHGFRVPPIPSTLSHPRPSHPPKKFPRKSETRIPPSPHVRGRSPIRSASSSPARPSAGRPWLLRRTWRFAARNLPWVGLGDPGKPLFPGAPGSNLAADGQCERSPSERDDLRGGCWPGESCGAGLREWSTWSEGSLSLGRRSGADLSGSSISVSVSPGPWPTRVCGFLRAAVLYCSSFRVCRWCDDVSFWLQVSTYRAARRWLSSWYEIVWYCSWTIFFSPYRGNTCLTFGISLFHMQTYIWPTIARTVSPKNSRVDYGMT
jgi:hypothetical protein